MKTLTQYTDFDIVEIGNGKEMLAVQTFRPDQETAEVLLTRREAGAVAKAILKYLDSEDEDDA